MTTMTLVSSTAYSYDGSNNMTGETTHGGAHYLCQHLRRRQPHHSEARTFSATTTTTDYTYNLNSSSPARRERDANGGLRLRCSATWTYGQQHRRRQRDHLRRHCTTPTTPTQCDRDVARTYAETGLYLQLNNQVVSATEYSIATISPTYLVQTINYSYDVSATWCRGRSRPPAGARRRRICLRSGQWQMYANSAAAARSTNATCTHERSRPHRSDTDGDAWLLTDYMAR